jgi:hypothetical protein
MFNCHRLHIGGAIFLNSAKPIWIRQFETAIESAKEPQIGELESFKRNGKP